MPVKASERYLKRRGNQYQFRRDIPEALRAAFGGKTAIIKPLATADTRVAKMRRDVLARETNEQFEDARSGRAIRGEKRIQAAVDMWQPEIEAHRDDPLAWSARAGVPVDREEEALDPSDMIEAEADRIGREHGDAAQARFLDGLHGRMAIADRLDAHLAELDLREKTKQGRRRDVAAFAEWAGERRLTVRQVTKRAAADFFEAALLPRDRKTASTKLSHLKVYWRWLIERGHYDGVNPWDGLRLPVSRKSKAAVRDDAERPFTDVEMIKLFDGLEKAGGRSVSRMRDAMTIAALSGMRLDEICRLTVEDCQDGAFAIREGKTDAAARTIPIHSGLVAIVEKRMRGKFKTARLFHDVVGRGLTLSDPLSKQFGRYIRAIGVADLREGHRRSKVNFHSFRRRFVQDALRAGQPLQVVSWVVGHSEGREGITVGVYDRQGPSEQQMQACVEAVLMPTSRVNTIS